MHGRWRGIRLRPLCRCRLRGGRGGGGRLVGVEVVGKLRACGLGKGLVWGCYAWEQGFVPHRKGVGFRFSVVTRGRVSVSEEGS